MMEEAENQTEEMILAPTLGKLGSVIGQRPWFSILFSVSVIALFTSSLFIWKPVLELSFNNGYTTQDAPSITEMKKQIEFFHGNNGKPWYMALFASPKNSNQSIHNLMNPVDKFYTTIKKTPFKIDPISGENVTYMDLCGNTCNLNNMLFETLSYTWGDPSYPVTTIFGYKSNIGKHFYNVVTDKDSTLQHSNLTMLVFMVFSEDETTHKNLKEFELFSRETVEVYNSNKSHSVRFTVHGEAGMSKSVEEGMKGAAMYLLYGIVLSAIFLFCVFITFSKTFDQLKCEFTPLIWIVALFVPIGSFVTSLAIFNLLGYAISVITLFSPFLAIVYGYDTVIMLSHTWLSDSELRRDAKNEHLREVFATCMPSILVTSTTAIGFLFCSLLPIPHFAGFSVLIGLILLSSVFFTIFLFAPCLMVIAPAKLFLSVPTQEYSRSSFNSSSNGFSQAVCELVATSTKLKVLTILALIVGICVPLYFAQVKGNLDYRQLLPPSSPNNEGVHYMSDIVWPQLFSVIFFITKPPNFSDPVEYRQFKKMIADIEEIPSKQNRTTDLTWINDYCSYAEISPSDDALDMSHFPAFISDMIYHNWKSGLKYTLDEKNQTTITNMVHIVSFSGTRSLADKASLFQKLRAITKKYPNFAAYPFDTEVGFVDIIEQTTSVVIFIPIAAYFVMFIGGFLFIGNFAVTATHSLICALIYTGSFIVPVMFGFYINPFTAAFCLILAAIAPKYTTHFGYFYQQAIRTNLKAERKDRVYETLRKSFVPVFTSCLCSTVLFIPALGCPIEIFRELAFYNLSLSVCGFVLSFFFLQILLNTIPPQLTGTHFLLSTPN